MVGAHDHAVGADLPADLLGVTFVGKRYIRRNFQLGAGPFKIFTGEYFHAFYAIEVVAQRFTEGVAQPLLLGFGAEVLKRQGNDTFVRLDRAA